jgi:hypothetical protein
MLGRLEMDIDECITSYSDLMETVFKERSRKIPFSFQGRIISRFDSKKLRTAIEEVVASRGASPSDLFNDDRSRGCRT